MGELGSEKNLQLMVIVQFWEIWGVWSTLDAEC